MNIFNSLRLYAGRWSVKNTRAFDAEEVKAIKEAHVVDSRYGKSACFIMKNGGMTFIPLAQDSRLATGDNVDITKCKLLTLSKQGEADIYRVKES